MQGRIAASPGGAPSPGELAGPTRRAIAVLGFKNLADRPESAWLSVALSEMLATELASDQLRIIPAENVARMKIELALSDTDSYSPDTLGRIRTNLAAESVILGSYLALGDRAGGKVRLDVRVQDARAGETVAAFAETGAEEDLFDLVARVGARLREKLNVAQRSASEASEARGSMPAGAEAARLYSEGLAKLRVFDAQGALELLRRAAEAEPEHPLSHWALAEAWSRIGYDARAQAEAGRAYELSGMLTRQERLSIEARYRETTREWDKAIKLYQMLWGFFPDQVDYGLLLAAAQTSAGQGTEALETVAELRRLPAPSGLDARIDLAEADAAFTTSDYRRMQVAAARASERGEAAESRLLVARAQALAGRAYWRLGEPDKALASLEAARLSYAGAGDLRGQAEVLHSIGVFLQWNREDLAGARQSYEQALDLLRSTGNKRGLAEVAFSIGNVLRAQGELGSARQMSEEALANFREVGARDAEAHTLMRIASLRALQGDVQGARTVFHDARDACHDTGKRELESFLLAEFAEALQVQGQMDDAQALLDEALELARDAGAKLETALALSKQADLCLDRGRLAEAKLKYEDSLEVARQFSSKSRIAYALHGLGGVLLAQGKPVGARRSYAEAQTIRRQAGNRLSASRIALAELALEEGLAGEAALEMRRAAQDFQERAWAEAEAQARLVLARAELAEGRPAEARKSIRRARFLTGRMGELRIGLRVDIEAARVLAAEAAAATRSEAVDLLEAARAAAARAGFQGLELEAGLALGQVELRLDCTAEGLARLEALVERAEALGFGLIAAKALVALGRAVVPAG